ncbi:MAG TPA: universal stress protein [Gaiellales bacterium]|jgi:nucleotide-binding universal stress UspA family protein|nr:universal stress protein [Gaiellales bacterium]
MKVLIAYDGSEEAGRVLTRAARIARGGDTEVTVISVVPLQPSGPRSAGPVMSGDIDEHKRELAEAVAKLKEAGVEAQSIEAVGHPAESIVDEAERGKFDLIIVGHRGRHGVERFLMGSTATRVVTHAHCDVLVVR